MENFADMTISEIADYVIRQLSGKMVIHRYDAYSTNSVYLKFDYGVANSLRISDHRGKKHLAYRFNIGLDIKEPYIQEQGNYPQEFYPACMTDRAINKILLNKKCRIQRYRNYDAVMKQASEKAQNEPGFWQQAKIATYQV